MLVCVYIIFFPAVVDLNGRYFGGRVVKACFYNLDKFRVLDLGEPVWVIQAAEYLHFLYVKIQGKGKKHLFVHSMYVFLYFILFMMNIELF